MPRLPLHFRLPRPHPKERSNPRARPPARWPAAGRSRMAGMPAPHRKPIAEWKSGDTVQGFAYLRKREERRDKGGRAYLDLELADATGAIPAKAWSDSAALSASYAAGDFVKFRGQVQSYREQLQLKLDNCRVATEDDRTEGFDESLLLPTSRHDLGELATRLERLLAEGLRRPEARALADAALARHGAALRLHPAAKTIHHAYRGGLIEHTVSMLELARKIAGHYPELDGDLLLLGVLFHDLGKIRELGVMPGSDYTPEGRLVGHIVLGRDLVRECAADVPDFPAELLLHLEHLVLSHQGRQEYGSPVLPATAEALALHSLDDLDSKLAQLRELAANQRGFQYVRALERFVWLGEDGAPEAVSEPEAPSLFDDSGNRDASRPRGR
jgi:3'-5' exoribonuclease